MRNGTLSINPTSSVRHDMRIQELMNSFAGKKTFSGGWEHNLDSKITVYEAMASMCRVSSEEKTTAIPVMKSGDAAIYYSSNA